MTIQADLFEAHATLEPRWLSPRSAVHGIGIGPREVLRTLTDDIAVRVYVTRKRPLATLAHRDRVPRFLDGIPVDVIESERAFVNAAGIQVASGASTGCHSVPFGTVGAFCHSTDPSDHPDEVLVLSNNHVFANLTGRRGDPVFHPGRDDSTTLNRFATLLRAFPIEPGSAPNQVDAAVAVLDPGIGHDLTIKGCAPLVGSRRARLNFLVTKLGRTTGLTTGVVTDLHCTEHVGLDPAKPELTARFVEQIRIDVKGGTVFADKGDSGSLVLDSGVGQAVGLYFAGPPSGKYGLANHIAAVIERLKIRLLTES